MGPSRRAAEAESAYRLRYALYCLRWFGGLALALGAWMALKPPVHDFPLPFLAMFFYLGLPLGTAVAGLGAFGFLIGAFWSKRLEQSRRLARNWPKAKAWLRALALLPISGFGVYTVARGVFHGEILIPRRYVFSTVALSEEPLGYYIALVVWCVLTAGLVYCQISDLRRAQAI